MRNVFLVPGAACLVLAAFGFVYFALYPDEPSDTRVLATIEIADTSLRVSVMDTPAEREKGLSGRTGLIPGEGMLFVFPNEGPHGFWMKDMLFSIDIIWISAAGTVVHVEPSLSPDSYPHVWKPQNPALFVLEVPAGFAERFGVKIGSKVVLPTP